MDPLIELRILVGTDHSMEVLSRPKEVEDKVRVVSRLDSIKWRKWIELHQVAVHWRGTDTLVPRTIQGQANLRDLA